MSPHACRCSRTSTSAARGARLLRARRACRLRAPALARRRRCGPAADADRGRRRAPRPGARRVRAHPGGWAICRTGCAGGRPRAARRGHDRAGRVLRWVVAGGAAVGAARAPAREPRDAARRGGVPLVAVDLICSASAATRRSTQRRRTRPSRAPVAALRRSARRLRVPESGRWSRTRVALALRTRSATSSRRSSARRARGRARRARPSSTSASTRPTRARRAARPFAVARSAPVDRAHAGSRSLAPGPTAYDGPDGVVVDRRRAPARVRRLRLAAQPRLVESLPRRRRPPPTRATRR